MMSSNGNIFRVIGPLWGESTGHRWTVDSPHKGQWRAALTFSSICASTNGWATNLAADDLGHYRAYYDVTVMKYISFVKHRCLAFLYIYARQTLHNISTLAQCIYMQIWSWCTASRTARSLPWSEIMQSQNSYQVISGAKGSTYTLSAFLHVLRWSVDALLTNDLWSTSMRTCPLSLSN